MPRKLNAKLIEAKRAKRKAESVVAVTEIFNVHETVALETTPKRPREIMPEPPPVTVGAAIQKLRAAAYARVSTAEEQQLGSYEAQVQYFTDAINNNPEYELVKVYGDHGVSGTLLKQRKGFQEMMEAALRGEIDIILVKSISRFGRNSADILNNLQILRTLNPPVTVCFEGEHLLTSDSRNDLLISILAAIAQLESQQKSEAIKFGIRFRMSQGTFKFSVKYTLGYYRDHFGNIKVDQAEAEIVRYIYESYLEGATIAEIAGSLTEMEICTPKGHMKWSNSTIRSILSNEKYNGTVLFQKTRTEDYRTHKSVKNRLISMWEVENHHTPIIPMAEWQKVQAELLVRKDSRKKGGGIGIMKKFTAPRIKSGHLKGYYLLDGNWTRQERETVLQIIESINNLDEEG
ncbi:MAG: Transposon gamma-delta resolvase [Firmicutes bacterium ADurb.Bin193]|nr:MAG: Transposon gamma-delta resolvase [Firmicutes bacterium ADurb.Bin193]